MKKDFEHVFYKKGRPNDFAREALDVLERIQTNAKDVSHLEWRTILLAANLGVFHDNIEPEIRQKFAQLPDDDRVLIHALMLRSKSRAHAFLKPVVSRDENEE
jgi:hypothetical protein